LRNLEVITRDVNGLAFPPGRQFEHMRNRDTLLSCVAS